MEHKSRGISSKLPLSSLCGLWLLQTLSKSSHSLILVIVPARSQKLLAIPLLPSLDSGLNIILMFPSPLGVIQSNFLTDIWHAYCFISSGKADNCSQVTKIMLQNVTNKSLICDSLPKTEEGWLESSGEEEEAYA